MAISRVTTQDATGSASAASVGATYAATPTQNNRLIAAVYSNVPTGSAAIAGWTLEIETAAGATANGAISIFSKVAGAGESTTVTATATAATVMRIHIYEYSNVATVSATDGSQANPSGATAFSSLAAGATALTTTNADDLLFATWGFNGSTTAWSVDSSFTLLQTNARLVTTDRIVAATGSYNPTLTWTNTNRVGALIVAFKEAAGGSSAAAGTASLALSASGDTQAPVEGSASLALAASGTATIPSSAAAGTASLSLTATGTTQARAVGTAALALTATGTTQARIVGTATLSLTATGATKARAVATAALTLTATGTAQTAGTHATADATRLLRVAAELRVLAVPAERRQLRVGAETRVLTVPDRT